MKCKNCNAEIPEENGLKIEDDFLCNECFVCLTDSKEEDRQEVQVTREMAMDAGDPGMEGTWIKW